MAGFDIFLKLDGINGESTTKGHEKEIEVVSYDQSIDSTVPIGGGGGGGAGKATFSGVRFRKLLDTASIPIALTCASGLHIASARFAFRRAPLDFYCGFRAMPATDSEACRASVPGHAGPAFRSMPA